MLLGAIVLCFLVLLVLLADRLGSRLWEGNSDRVFYRCASCDLRYPRREIVDVNLRVCPAGHPVVLEPRRTAAGTIAICACLGFLCVAIAFMVTGFGR